MSSCYLINGHVACSDGVQGQIHVILGPVDLGDHGQWTHHGSHHHTHLGVLAQLYPDLLAAAVQRPARDAKLRGGLLDRHPAPDGLERSVEVILGSEVSVRGQNTHDGLT